LLAGDQLIEDQPKPWTSRAKAIVIPWIALSVVQFNPGDFNAVAPAMDFGVGSFVTPRRHSISSLTAPTT
jgi:hypothetical protein